jgi:hypothetical protein
LPQGFQPGAFQDGEQGFQMEAAVLTPSKLVRLWHGPGDGIPNEPVDRRMMTYLERQGNTTQLVIPRAVRASSRERALRGRRQRQQGGYYGNVANAANAA